MKQAIKRSRKLHRTLTQSVVLAVGLVMLGFLSACAAPPSAPEDNFYGLSPMAATTMKRSLDGVVEVERFVASGALGNRPLLYREPGSNVLRGYNSHLWLDAPPTLLQNALVSYLRSAGAARQVVTPEMRAPPIIPSWDAFCVWRPFAVRSPQAWSRSNCPCAGSAMAP